MTARLDAGYRTGRPSPSDRAGLVSARKIPANRRARSLQFWRAGWFLPADNLARLFDHLKLPTAAPERHQPALSSFLSDRCRPVVVGALALKPFTWRTADAVQLRSTGQAPSAVPQSSGLTGPAAKCGSCDGDDPTTTMARSTEVLSETASRQRRQRPNRTVIDAKSTTAKCDQCFCATQTGTYTPP